MLDSRKQMCWKHVKQAVVLSVLMPYEFLYSKMNVLLSYKHYLGI